MLAGTGVLPHHATLRWSEDGVWVEPAEGAPVKLNGPTLDGPARLGGGDWLLLGTSSYAVRVRGAATAALSPAPAARKARVLTMGRVPESDVQIVDATGRTDGGRVT